MKKRAISAARGAPAARPAVCAWRGEKRTKQRARTTAETAAIRARYSRDGKWVSSKPQAVQQIVDLALIGDDVITAFAVDHRTGKRAFQHLFAL